MAIKRRETGSEDALMMNIIVRLSESEGPIATSLLCAELKISPNYLWKLLVKLDGIGVLHRRHGWVEAASCLKNRPRATRFERSMGKLEPARAAVAQYAAQEILSPKDFVLAVDSGATCCMFLENIIAIPNDGRTIVTNNVGLCFTDLFGTQTKIELLSGCLDPDSGSLRKGMIGDPAKQFDELTQKTHFDLSIVVPLSITWSGSKQPSLRLWTNYPEEVKLRCTLIHSAARVVFLVTPERVTRRGNSFARLGKHRSSLRSIDKNIFLVCAAHKDDLEMLEFIETAKNTPANVHVVSYSKT